MGPSWGYDPPRPPRSLPMLKPSPSVRLAALLALTAFPACKSVESRTAHPAAPVAPSQVQTQELDPVSEAMARGDLDAAQLALDELLFERELNTASLALTEGSPEDALVAVDRALAIGPKDLRAILLKAQASRALADKMVAEGAGPLFIEGALADAFDSYTRLAPTPINLTAAAELATRLDRQAVALELGRRAVMDLDDNDDEANLKLAERAHTAWSQAAMRAYIAQLQFHNGSGGKNLGLDVEATFNEAEDALMATLGFAAEDVQSWTNLANLYLWRGDLESAAETDLRGLERILGDRSLLEALVAAENRLGEGRALAALMSLGEGPPMQDLFLGRTRLMDAIPLQASDPARALDEATAAEAELARIHSTYPAIYEEARGWRVIARAVQGWALYNQSELDKAARTFRSMDEILDGGVAWLLDGSVRSGIDGLFFIGDQYRQAGDWESAAKTFGALEDAQPGDSNWANNAGFFARDAAVALEAEGRDLCLAAHGELTDDRRLEELRELAGVSVAEGQSDGEARAFGVAANERFRRARALAQQSYASYVHASSLVPNDVRIVNDTALIQVYYLHEDLDAARAYLERSIALGEAQLTADDAHPTLDEEARRALEEAWGDAHQNMGVMHLMLLDDPEGALPFLEKSRDIGPAPRPMITQALIPWCRGQIDAPIEAIMPEVNWCAPCTKNQ